MNPNLSIPQMLAMMLQQQGGDENASKDLGIAGSFTRDSGLRALASLAGANDMTPIFGQNYSDINYGRAIQRSNAKAPNYNSNQFNLSQYSEDAIV